ncbi:cytochrome P450 4V2-like [Uloborus diversus]|uniref:cytochrome P450 4V2-like n=1 Tax=Uloborus diversus TaxID=327109 RepID=UPI0024093602|nr:cytochrome P450 4V2-like [Uloborus diversus]
MFVLLFPTFLGAFERAVAISKQFEKDGFVLFWISFRRLLFVYKAEIVKILLNHPAVQEKSSEYNPLKSFVGEGLFVLDSHKAQRHRKVITPSFHMGILKNYTIVFNEQAIEMVKRLKKDIHQPWIDVESYVRLCTHRVICQTAMGLQVDTNDDMKEFVKAIDTNLHIVAHRIFRPWTQWDAIYQFFPTGRKMKKAIATTHQIINKIILDSKEILLSNDELSKSETSEEEDNADSRLYTRKKTFIQLLLETHLKDPSFTINDIRDEVLSFVGAGAETLTITVNVILMMLGLYQDVQRIAMEEVDGIFENGNKRFVTAEDVSEMKYLDCVIKECLRLYPSAPIVAREISEDIHFGKYVIPKNTGLLVNIHLLHRDPEYFPNPEKFDPTRFFPENIHARHPYAYMPFSAGARNCIGQKFAVIQMKVILSHVLRNFKIQSLDHRDTLNFSFQISIKNVKPIRLKLTPRYS